ncbi:CmpA/NrtA family ABC transporter substrate-binding protein [Novosphingobium pentaromativorans]|uniref:Sulfonate/nitrate/taurine transport system ATP-binding protein n=1 Tax=Novosphingobium pentaromativorans US6-1 TaxID=1088721 RepID=G6EE88_9SPHN|nr:CmpA/NrtA family ABC transporter substrate-binding protein [Novosphingobium pentaromativorans]AIT79510.1 nitrate transporter [Novosphingobium pentaromativorans US6-1]EHJ60311.1 sulfonate/nitrate/taurine transport system ATP-binding protein [Novosphingobium pentaromativorans US6-1]
MSTELTVGFLPLVDACLPILAKEHGFAEEEGVTLSLVKDMSWATVLDRLLYGHSDAAHLVAPLAIAATLGRGRPAQSLSVPFVLGLNGNAVTLRPEIARMVRPEGQIGDAAEVGAALKTIAQERKAAGKPLTFGVVHRYSSHNYMLRYWLAGCGIRPDIDVDITTVPPPFCADALKQGEVDGICVGEPWNSVAVEQGAGEIVLSTAQIWRRGVEKVLALREQVLDEKREGVQRLIRALCKAGAHFVDPVNWELNAEILARPEYLDGSAELIRRAISDQLLIARGGALIHYPDFMFQYREAANFPWVSQAEWLYTQMVRWDNVPFDAQDAQRAARVFRPDVYRSALLGTGEPLPGASSKVEGSIETSMVVSTQQGAIQLEPNTFFDGEVFDPSDIEGYLSRLP